MIAALLLQLFPKPLPAATLHSNLVSLSLSSFKTVSFCSHQGRCDTNSNKLEKRPTIKALLSIYAKTYREATVLHRHSMHTALCNKTLILLMVIPKFSAPLLYSCQKLQRLFLLPVGCRSKHFSTP